LSFDQTSGDCAIAIIEQKNKKRIIPAFRIVVTLSVLIFVANT